MVKSSGIQTQQSCVLGCQKLHQNWKMSHDFAFFLFSFHLCVHEDLEAKLDLRILIFESTKMSIQALREKLQKSKSFLVKYIF